MVVSAEGEEIYKGGKTGPNLYGVIGRVAGSYDGYKYGKGLSAAQEEGFVWISTDNNLAAKIIKRCSKDIVEVLERGEGFVEFKIRRSSFRGIEYAFKTSNNEKKKKVNPTWLWEKKKQKSS